MKTTQLFGALIAATLSTTSVARADWYGSYDREDCAPRGGGYVQVEYRSHGGGSDRGDYRGGYDRGGYGGGGYGGGYGGGGYSHSSSTEARAQIRLRRMGYYHGPIDGDFGYGSRRALARFQRDHGLAPNGWLDWRTRRALGI